MKFVQLRGVYILFLVIAFISAVHTQIFSFDLQHRDVIFSAISRQPDMWQRGTVLIQIFIKDLCITCIPLP